MGTLPGVTVYDLWHCFLHVLYRLWSIGMAASHLEVITMRGRTREFGVIIIYGILGMFGLE